VLLLLSLNLDRGKSILTYPGWINAKMASSERSPLLTNSSPPSSGQQRKTSTNRDDEDAEEEAGQKTWISNLVASVKIAPRNQGLLFVLAAEIVGASMDATVRFVQQSQGRTGFPLFEVRSKIPTLYMKLHNSSKQSFRKEQSCVNWLLGHLL